MSTASPEASSEAGEAGAAPVLVTRERRRRSARYLVPRLVVLLGTVVGLVAVTGGELHPAGFLAVAALAIPAGIRLRPRTLAVYPDHLELVRGGHRERISLLELTGLGVRPGAPAGAKSWAGVVRLRTLTTSVDLADLVDPDGAWAALAQYVLPALADSYVERLQRSKDLDMGSVRADRAGLHVAEHTIPWDRLGTVTLEPDGVLIQVRGRPDLAWTLPARDAPGAPLLPRVRDGWLTHRADVAGAGELPPPRASRRFPVDHPELGALHFARHRPALPALVRWLWGAATLALSAGAGAIGMGVSLGATHLPRGVWLAPGFTLVAVALILGRLWGRSTGTEFAVYEGGLEGAGGAIPWDGVRALTLARRPRGQEWVARGEVTEIVLEAEQRSVKLQVTGAEGRAYRDWFIRELGDRLARRDLMRIQAGDEVTYPFATLTRTGLVVEGQEVGWEQIIGVAVEGGATQVVRQGDRGRPLLAVPEGARNASVFTRVVQTWLTEAARSDAETSAVAEAAALAAAAAVAGVAE